MKLEFLGTRGYIEARTTLHCMHTSCRVTYRGKGAVIDCGEDWVDRLDDMNPRAIVITHAHPDHAGGLKNGAPCPVYATDETWKAIENYPVSRREAITPRKPIEIRGVTFEAFEVEHSTRAPAVGYRITAGRVSVFYVPDLVYIKERADALDIDQDEFVEMMRSRRGSLKTALMDQSFIAGIGNVYSDEVLFQAKLDPGVKCSALDDKKLVKLYATMRDVLKTAIINQADPDKFPATYITRRRSEGEPCPRCSGKIQKRTVSQRSSYVCPKCQKTVTPQPRPMRRRKDEAP